MTVFNLALFLNFILKKQKLSCLIKRPIQNMIQNSWTKKLALHLSSVSIYFIETGHCRIVLDTIEMKLWFFPGAVLSVYFPDFACFILLCTLFLCRWRAKDVESVFELDLQVLTVIALCLIAQTVQPSAPHLLRFTRFSDTCPSVREWMFCPYHSAWPPSACVLVAYK